MEILLLVLILVGTCDSDEEPLFCEVDCPDAAAAAGGGGAGAGGEGGAGGATSTSATGEGGSAGAGDQGGGEAGQGGGGGCAADSVCGGECVDLSVDPQNCGACGRDCLGGPCEAGYCAPIEVGIDPTASKFVSHDGVLYWASEPHTGVTFHSIQKAPSGGMAPFGTMVKTDQYRVEWLSAEADGLYYIWSGDPYFAPWDSGRSVLLYPEPGGTLGPAYDSVVAANDTHIFWNMSGGGVYSVAKNGSSREARVPVPPAKLVAARSVYIFYELPDGGLMRAGFDGTYQYQLAADGCGSSGCVADDGVIWTGGDRITAVPTAGGPPDVGPRPTVFIDTAATGRRPRKLAVDAQSVFWTSADGIMKAPKAGGDPVVVTPDVDDSSIDLAVDDRWVYWKAAGTVRKVAK